MFLCVFSLSKGINDSILDFLNGEFKNIELRGTLHSKCFKKGTYIYEIKSKTSAEVSKIVLPEKVFNAKEIFEFIEKGDYFYKVKGELKLRLGHKLEGNIEIRQFELLPPKDE